MQLILYDKFTELFDLMMGKHPTVKQSFFIRFLLTTAFIGNIYICLQALAHLFNYHGLDLSLRWYSFKANQFWNILLIIGTVFTLIGLRNIFRNGIRGFKLYGLGK